MPEEKKKTKKSYRWLRRALRVILGFIVLIALFFVGLIIAVKTPSVQKRISNYAIESLNKEFNTQLSVDSVSIDFFGDINLFNVKSLDHHKQEFINIPRIKVSSTMWSIEGIKTLINSQEKITLNYIKLYQPNVQVITYKGETNSNFMRFIEAFDDGKPSDGSDFILDGNIDIEDGILLIKNMNLPENEQVWLKSKSFNGSIRDFKYINTLITADLRSLNFDAIKNGENYRLKNLSTVFEYSDSLMSFKDLDFETEDSRLTGILEFKYDSIGQFSDFSNKIKWTLNLENKSKISFKDIRYWTNGWEKNNTVNIAGTVKGTLNNLTISNLELQGNNVNVSANSLHLTKVTNAEQLTIDAVGLNTSASYHNLKNLLPSELSKNIDSYIERFGSVEYQGNFKYDRQTIEANGLVGSALGQADLNISVKNYLNLEEIEYTGTINTNGFDLKSLTEAEELGEIAGNLNFNGKGTELTNLTVNANGQIQYIDLLGKRYAGITLDGAYQKESFRGIASINNKHLNLNYNGVIDFSKKPYYLNFESTIQHLDFDYLGLSNNNSSLKGIANGEIYYTSVDDFTGNVVLDEVIYANNVNEIDLNQIYLEANNFGDANQLFLDVSNHMTAEINGQFVLSELPDAIMNSFQDLIINYEPKQLSENQNFEFDIQIEKDLIHEFYPTIIIQPNTSLSGIVDTNSQHITAQLITPGLNYSGLDFIGTNVDINSRREKNPLIIYSDSIQIEGFTIKDVRTNANSIDDQLKINTNFYSGKKNPVTYQLNFVQRINAEGKIEIGFDPSTVKINNKKWTINENADFYSNRLVLDFQNNQYILDHVEATNSGQKLNLNGYYNSLDDYNIEADVEDLFLSNIIPKGTLGDLTLEGVANGNLSVEKTENSLKPTVDLEINDIVFNQYEMGNLSLEGEYNTLEKKAYLEGLLNKGQQQTLYLIGHIDNSTAEPTLDVDVNFDEFALNFLGGFLEGVVSNLRGDTSGNLKFTGPVLNPNYMGNLTLQNIGFKVDYLNIDYEFEKSEDILVSKQQGLPGTILLNAIDFKDTQFSTQGTVTGHLLFEQLTDWYIDLSFDSKKLLVLNTTEYHNELFYGRVFANFSNENIAFEGGEFKNGELNISGTTDNLSFFSNAKISGNSELTINTGSYFVDTDNSLVKFVPNQNASDRNEENDLSTKFTMNLNVDIDDTSTISLIFDSVSNDKLWALGHSDNLQIVMNQKGDLSMNGDYEVEYGVYEFRRLPTPKDFIIQSGGNIHWSNSPYNADLNITATYEKIVSNIGDYIGIGTSPAQEVNLNIILTETLQQPVIEFDINVPNASSDIKTQLDARLKSSPEEEFKQFGFIVLTGQFGANDTNVFSSGDVIARSAAADIALRQISNLFSSIAKEVQIDFNYISGSESSETADRLGARVNLLIDPRWTLKGTGGVPLSNVYNESLTFEVEAEYDASKDNDGSILVKGFSRPTTFGVENFNTNTAATQSYGVGITYTKSVDRLGDLFKSKARIQREEQQRKQLQQQLREKRKQLRDSLYVNPQKESSESQIIDLDSTLNQIQKDTITKEKLSKKEKFNKKQTLLKFK